MTWCLCAHQRTDHPRGQRCNHGACGCSIFRPGPIPARFRDLDVTLAYRRGGRWVRA